MRATTFTILTLLTTLLTAVPALAKEEPPMGDALSYVLRFPHPETHRVEVEMHLPTAGREQVELMMATWTPGSYLIREFARQVESLSAGDTRGAALPADKTTKNRWRVHTGGAAEVVVRYRLYAREMSVRTNFVDAGFALMNGAPTFLTRLDDGAPAAVPHRVTVELPEGWETAVSALPRGDAPHPRAVTFVAPDYDTLVDSPIYAGSPRIQSLRVADAELVLLDEGGDGVWDSQRAGRDVAAVARAHHRLWGGFPFRRYVILNLITEAGGGLEHKSSTVLMTSRWKARREEDWRDWLGLVSHELFHAWNGKRLRPRTLGPFDYEAENYTPSLWFVEGVTSYYDDLLVHRAGLSSRDDLFRDLGSTLEKVRTTPGRRVQSLADASFDAWIKHYRRDENSVNRNVSYYAKGALVAWLLDTRIRRASDGARSLDDLLRTAFERYSGPRGYAPEDLPALVAEIADTATADWLRGALTTTGDLDFAPVEEWYGLEFVSMDEDGDGRGGQGGDGEGEKAGWLGADTEVRDGRLVVTEVRRDTPAFDAGLNTDDEILALGDHRVPPGGLAERLKRFRPGEAVSLLVARRERLLRLAVTLGAEPERPYRPAPRTGATDEQKARLDAWLGPPAKGDGHPRQGDAEMIERDG